MGLRYLHARTLVRLKPSSLVSITPTTAKSEQIPKLKHPRIFGCMVFVPIPPPPHRTKMDPLRREWIYIGCESPSITRCLDFPTRDLL